MVKILKQDDLAPEGFSCNGSGKIVPNVITSAFNCSQLAACSITSFDDVNLDLANAGDLLMWDGTGIGSTTIDTGIQIGFAQPAHGFTMPAHGFIPVYINGTVFVEANTTHMDRTHIAFIVSVPTADSLLIQQGGILNVLGGHGLTVGERYYLRDDGSISTTPAAGIVDLVAYPIDTENILLEDDDAVVVSTHPQLLAYKKEFVGADFSGTGPYTLTIDAAEHGLQADKYITANIYESGTPNTLVQAQVDVTDTGTITITTTSTFAGYLMLFNPNF
jgi:hypothetical protein